MRPFLIVASFLALVSAHGACASAASTTQLSIDPVKSKAHFSIEHIFVDRVVGTIPILSGTVSFSTATATPVSVTAILDPTRTRTDDPDRDAALESLDYFDVRKFPTWTFVSTKVISTGSATFGMDGILTIHGVARPEHLDVLVRGDASHPTYHAIGRIDRHAFGMKGARLDPVIGNTADVTLDIVLQVPAESKEMP